LELSILLSSVMSEKSGMVSPTFSAATGRSAAARRGPDGRAAAQGREAARALRIAEACILAARGRERA